MLFNSSEFFLFIIVIFSLYYLPIIKQWQVHLLIAANCFFYAYYTPELLFLLLFSMISNAAFSHKIHYSTKKYKKNWLRFGVIVNLTTLVFFKYTPLFVHTLFGEMSINNSENLTFLSNVILPIGISFYTFQGISLIVNTYRNDEHTLIVDSFGKHLIRTCFYISFFPQLIAGPIERSNTFMPQIKGKAFSNIDWEKAITTLIQGFFLKVFIADNLSTYTSFLNTAFVYDRSSLNLILLTFGYCFQIFADFAGYSLIALGLAKLFGYNLSMNFNYPFVSGSFSEFWKRWHISLSTWFKEYLYIPLGGNRVSSSRIYFNIFIVMALSGFWHGNTYNYLLWGVLHGLILIIEIILERITSYRPPFIVRATFIFNYVTLCFLLFVITDIHQVSLIWDAVIHNFNLSDHPIYRINEYVIVLITPVVLLHLNHYFSNRNTNYSKISNSLRPIFYAIMLFFTILSTGPKTEFIYFQF